MSNEEDPSVEGSGENPVNEATLAEATPEEIELADAPSQPERSPEGDTAESQSEEIETRQREDQSARSSGESTDLPREEGLEQHARRLDERERGLDQLRNELDEREEELRSLREQLEGRREELDAYEAELEQRSTELNSREEGIKETESALKQRARELDEREEVLEMYVEDRVSDALDGRIDRIEKVVGERIAALESDLSETVESDVSAALEHRETAGRFDVVGGTLLGLLGVGFVATGALLAVSGDVGWMPAIADDTATQLAAGGLLFFVGLALNLAAAADRL